MRYFITLSYDGTDFHGWQIQPNGNSVQEELQKALSTLLRQSVAVVACMQGRWWRISIARNR